MANELVRVFGTDKAKLAEANIKGSACPKIGTKFDLTGKFVCEEGYVDRASQKRVHTENIYCYFEGKRNSNERPGGISAGVFLRRPYDGFTDSETSKLTEFHKDLLACENAGDLFDLFEKKGWKTIVVKDIVRHNEVPFGKDKEQPVPYSVFDIE